MAKLPSYRRIIKSDYEPETQDVIETLSESINPAFDVIFETLNKRVTLRDNIKSTVKDLRVIVDSQGAPINTLSFSLDVTGTVDGCIVLNAINRTNTALGVAAAPFISFTQNGSVVIVNNIKGLIANNDYQLRIVTFVL